MPDDVVYGVQVCGQEFTIRIRHPKAKYQYRAYLTNAANVHVSSGRWNTPEEADRELREQARLFATRVEKHPANQANRVADM